MLRSFKNHVLEEVRKPTAEQISFVQRACGYPDLGADDGVGLVHIGDDGEAIREMMDCGGRLRKSHVDSFCLAHASHALESAVMQRWIYTGLVACLVVGGAMVFFFMKMRSNRPESRWVPIAIRSDITVEQKTEVVSAIEKYVKTDKTLQEVAAECDLKKQLGVATDDDAKRWLAERAFVRLGKLQNAQTSKELETVDIGVNGKRKEIDALNTSATKLGDKVRKMLDASVK
jgi:hypothetical protein